MHPTWPDGKSSKTIFEKWSKSSQAGPTCIRARANGEEKCRGGVGSRTGKMQMQCIVYMSLDNINNGT